MLTYLIGVFSGFVFGAIALAIVDTIDDRRERMERLNDMRVRYSASQRRNDKA